MSAIQGAMVAVVTPFKEDRVDVEAFRRIVEMHIEGGLNGIVPCGTTGESATLSHEEFVQVVRACVEQVAGRVPVIAGVGTQRTRTTIERAQQARELGADGLLVVTPPYNKPNQEGLYQHFVSVADAVPLPQVVYNVPGRTSQRIEVATLARLAQHDAIVAVKDATADMTFAAETIEACGDGLTLLSGDDFTTFPFLALGGQGMISVVGNVAPRLMSDLWRACREARWTDARQLHYQLLPLARALFVDTNPIPVKAALARMGFCENTLRLPLVTLEERMQPELDRALSSAGLI